MNDSSSRVLIVNTHGLGDIVMMLPMLRALQGVGSEVGLILKNSSSKTLLQALAPDVAARCVCFCADSDGRSGGLSAALRMIRFSRSFSPSAVIPVFSQHPEKAAILARASGAKSRVGFGGKLGFLNTINVASDTEGHKVAYNLGLAGRVFPRIDVSHWSERAYGHGRAMEGADTFDIGERLGLRRDSKFVCIAPGCGERESHKRWPMEKFGELCRQLVEKGITVVLVGSPAETELSTRILAGQERSSQLIDAIGKLTLVETLQMIAQANGVVCNCNGMSHIAAYMGTRTIGLYGPTNAAKTGPYGPHVGIVQTTLSCAPCYRRGFIEGCGKPVCMDDISVSTVFERSLEHFEL